MVCVHHSDLCPNKQGAEYVSGGGSALQVHAVSHSGGMVLWVMAGRCDLHLIVESETWLRGLVFPLLKFYLPWNWRCQSEQKEYAHGFDWASSSHPYEWDRHILLMNSIEQSPLEAHSFTASWEFSMFYGTHMLTIMFTKPVAHFCPSQMNPVYILSVSLRPILTLSATPIQVYPSLTKQEHDLNWGMWIVWTGPYVSLRPILIFFYHTCPGLSKSDKTEWVWLELRDVNCLNRPVFESDVWP